MNIHTVEWNLFLFSCVGDAEKHFFFFLSVNGRSQSVSICLQSVI